ncbi:MAG: hypothetical protein E7633_09050 [Ruminococcaceae bacterium]|nr:hypothetical protein [Oscillospiraceae bacterium]
MDTAYIKRIGFYLILAVLALALIASLIYHAFESLSDDLELMFLSETSDVEALSMKAYMSVEEYVISDSEYVAGISVEYVKGQNALVSLKDTVIRLYDSDNAQNLITQLEYLNERMEFCKKASDYAAKYSVARLNELIDKTENSLLSSEKNSDKNKLRTEYETLLAARSSKMGNSVDYAAIITSYQNEIKEIYSNLGKAVKEYNSTLNGAYFSSCDGYESKISQSELSSSDLQTVLDKISDEYVSGETGKLGKFVNLNSWYLVCSTDKTSTYYLKKGDKFDVELGSSGRICKMTVDRVVTERGYDEAVVVFYSDMMLELDDYEHYQDVKVILKEHKGYKLPITAVRYENGLPGVYVLRGSMVKYRLVEILSSGDGYVIVSGNVVPPEEGMSSLSRYDRVIVRGQNLFDGKVIVYD